MIIIKKMEKQREVLQTSYQIQEYDLQQNIKEIEEYEKYKNYKLTQFEILYKKYNKLIYCIRFIDDNLKKWWMTQKDEDISPLDILIKRLNKILCITEGFSDFEEETLCIYFYYNDTKIQKQPPIIILDNFVCEVSYE